jgi:hypothetical protein
MTYPGDFLLALHLYTGKAKGAEPVTLPEKKTFPSTPEPKDDVKGPQKSSFINPFVFIRVHSWFLILYS